MRIPVLRSSLEQAADRFDHRRPIAYRALADEPYRGIPEHPLALLAVAPVGAERHHDDRRPAERSGEVNERGAYRHDAVERTHQRGSLVVHVYLSLPVVHGDAMARGEIADFVVDLGVLQADEVDAVKAQQRQQLLQRQRAPRLARMADAALP